MRRTTNASLVAALLVACTTLCTPCEAFSTLNLLRLPHTQTPHAHATTRTRTPPNAPSLQAIDAPVKIPDTFVAPPETKNQNRGEKAKKYKLLLFNDNVNKREYVAKVLTGAVPELTQADAYLVMQKAHQSGMAVVGVWAFEVAEAYCELLKKGGLISSITEEE